MSNGSVRNAAVNGPLGLRSRVLAAVRAFFLDREYIEVETPVRVAAPALEAHIDAEPSGSCFLRTSPELFLKRLVAAGHERVFEMGPCFRRGERGALHRPEYTMLEWYRAGAGYGEALAETLALLRAVARGATGGTTVQRGGVAIDLAAAAEVWTVAAAFQTFAGWDPVAAFDAERFDLDLVERVEPALAGGARPVVLTDYPAARAALARLKAGNPRVAERWELYLGGVELANAFGELTDAAEQRARFARCAAERAAAGRAVYPVDEAFLAALDAGLPDCAGVALGIDRLVMLLGGYDTIGEVRAFS